MPTEVLAAVDPTGTVQSHRTMGTGKRNFDALTGLRFFAAFAVVLYHFASILLHSRNRIVGNLIDSGFTAVSFFYVLSGFVLAYSYVSREGAMQGSRRSFWVARLARIYPAYLLAFLLAAPTNIIWSLNVNSLKAGIVKLAVGAVSVLSMQQAWTPWSAWYWNYPAWSVSVEAFFYLAFPFLVPLVIRLPRHKLVQAIAAFWLLGLVVPVLVSAFHRTVPGGTDRLMMATEFTPLLRLPEFIVGMLLGRYFVLGGRIRARAFATYSSTICILLTLGLGGSTIPRLVLSNGLLVPLFCCLILGLAEGGSLLAKALSWAPLVVLGEASYGVYILQIPVSYVLRMPPPLTSFAALTGYNLVLVITALLSWRFVEAPLRVRIRNWLAKPEKRPILQ